MKLKRSLPQSTAKPGRQGTSTTVDSERRNEHIGDGKGNNHKTHKA